MSQAVQRIGDWISEGQPTCRFVVTPNVDHIVQLYRQKELIPLYRQASMTLADGWPLVSMSRLYGKPLPERVAGSDLLPAICEKSQSDNRPVKLFLLGGKPGVPQRAAQAIANRWPVAEVIGSSSPPLGFENDPVFNQELCSQINQAEPDILVVGLGFPKQESWILNHRERLRTPVALAVGGTIDFLAGEQTRAPKWTQAIKMEWLHRLATNPRRLAKRYALDAIYFPWICIRQGWHDA
ncbi:Putative N-acetylmannosaminyltransferase [Roseimaritima multifibrata]|uniref:N-acetylmannosaminyltransferase n=2 Tax=Roseimaritima multifibrata TaxID=1930274 RepID=A0A517MMF5_9BACT|nr:Putative N-acetylmannosaminyltransferase [Roseimaritima multifibrata]